MEHISKTLKKHPVIRHLNFWKKVGVENADYALDSYITKLPSAAYHTEYSKVLEVLGFYKQLLAIFKLVFDNPKDERIAHRTLIEWAEKYKKRLQVGYISQKNVADALESLEELENYVMAKLEENPIPDNVELPLELEEAFTVVEGSNDDLGDLFADLEDDEEDLSRSKKKRQQVVAKVAEKKELVKQAENTETLSDLFQQDEETVAPQDSVEQEDPFRGDRIMQELLLTPPEAKRKVAVALARKHPPRV